MNIDRNTNLFFDASCLIAAAGSPSGGSGFLISLCGRNLFKAVASQPVLLETERNIQAKLSREALNNFHLLMSITPFILVSVPDAPEIERIGQMINPKDAHVVAAAREAGAHFLLTLDKRLITQVNQAELLMEALLPGDFIKFRLPFHQEFPKGER